MRQHSSTIKTDDVPVEAELIRKDQKKDFLKVEDLDKSDNVGEGSYNSSFYS